MKFGFVEHSPCRYASVPRLHIISLRCTHTLFDRNVGWDIMHMVITAKGAQNRLYGFLNDQFVLHHNNVSRCLEKLWICIRKNEQIYNNPM
jgi:hypothetical protein